MLRDVKFLGFELVDFMSEVEVLVRGDSMWPTLKDGQMISCITYIGQKISVGQIVVFPHPFESMNILIKRVDKIAQNRLFVVGDNPDPTATEDSHNFGMIESASVIAVKV